MSDHILGLDLRLPVQVGYLGRHKPRKCEVFEPILLMTAGRHRPFGQKERQTQALLEYVPRADNDTCGSRQSMELDLVD